MSISAIRLEPVAVGVRFTASALVVDLADGRQVSAPLDWFPRLRKASARQRRDFQLMGGGIGIHWPSLDEDISVENLLLPKALVSSRKVPRSTRSR
ncbi:MAG: DUF2442 domain-containing protein [Terriglobales bacterium]